MNIHNIQTSLKYNLSFAFDAGLHVPDLLYLNTLSEEKKKEIYFNPTWEVIEDIAIKKIPGQNIRLINFFNSQKYTEKTLCINYPYLLDGKQGGNIGENAITLFKNKNKIGKEPMEKIKEKLNKDYLDYVSYDCVYINKVFYFKKIILGLTDYMSYLVNLFHEKEENFLTGLKLNLLDPEVGDIVEEYLDNNKTEYNRQYDYFIIYGTGRDIGKAWKNLYKKIPAGLNQFGVHHLVNASVDAKNSYYGYKRFGLF